MWGVGLRVQGVGSRVQGSGFGIDRGTSLIREQLPVGPYNSPMPRVLWGSSGGWAFSYGRGSPVGSMVEGSGCEVQGREFSVWVAGLRVQGLGFRIQGLGPNLDEIAFNADAVVVAARQRLARVLHQCYLAYKIHQPRRTLQ